VADELEREILQATPPSNDQTTTLR